MTLKDIASLRLINQQIAQPSFATPKALVTWLGALQAQDYAGACWAIGLRLPNATEATIETAISSKKIVRTWPMRGTLHFVAATDVRWMLSLLAPRVLARTAGIYKLAGLDDGIFKKSLKILIKALEGDHQLTRQQLYDVLEKAKITTDGQRGLHILGYWAQQGLICFGPHQGKQPSFVLLDEWLPKTKELTKQEALSELATRYFNSHGPATIQDFAWWSGLTLTDAKKGLESINANLQQVSVIDQEYWLSKEAAVENSSPGLFLLPSFDEYLVAYKDRSAAFEAKHQPLIVKSGNGIFSPVIVVDGRVAGTWKRQFVKEKVEIEVTSFSSFTKKETESLENAANKYGDFLSRETSLRMAKQATLI